MLSWMTCWIVYGNLWVAFWSMVPILLAAFWLGRYLKKQKRQVLHRSVSPPHPVSAPVQEDRIAEVGIDDLQRLYIKPETFVLSSIYKAAGGVLWDNEGGFLFSPPPRGWSYLDWYRYMLKLAETECRCALKLTYETKWTNIPDVLKQELVNLQV